MQPRPPEAAFLGVGIGLRPRHYAEIAACNAEGADFFEAISENYMLPGAGFIACEHSDFSVG